MHIVRVITILNTHLKTERNSRHLGFTQNLINYGSEAEILFLVLYKVLQVEELKIDFLVS